MSSETPDPQQLHDLPAGTPETTPAVHTASEREALRELAQGAQDLPLNTPPTTVR